MTLGRRWAFKLNLSLFTVVLKDVTEFILIDVNKKFKTTLPKAGDSVKVTLHKAEDYTLEKLRKI